MRMLLLQNRESIRAVSPTGSLGITPPNELTEAHYLRAEGVKLMEDKQPSHPEQASRALFAREVREKRKLDGRDWILRSATTSATPLYLADSCLLNSTNLQLNA